jgi:hypothetical protein
MSFSLIIFRSNDNSISRNSKSSVSSLNLSVVGIFRKRQWIVPNCPDQKDSNLLEDPHVRKEVTKHISAKSQVSVCLYFWLSNGC